MGSAMFEEKLSPKSIAPEARRKRSSKTQSKDDETAPTPATTTPGRKRKSTKKGSGAADKVHSPEEPSRSCKVPDEQEGKDRTTTARLAREGHSECIPEGPSHAHEGSGPANECSPARPCEL